MRLNQNSYESDNIDLNSSTYFVAIMKVAVLSTYVYFSIENVAKISLLA